jgi:hypothetical protein
MLGLPNTAFGDLDSMIRKEIHPRVSSLFKNLLLHRRNENLRSCL